MRDPASGTMVLAVHGDEVVAGFVQNSLEFVDSLGGFAAENLLLGLGEAFASLGRFAAQARGFRRRLRANFRGNQRQH